MAPIFRTLKADLVSMSPKLFCCLGVGYAGQMTRKMALPSLEMWQQQAPTNMTTSHPMQCVQTSTRLYFNY